MLKVTNLSKRYGQKQAIDGISFSIRQGEAVGFLGVNGAGKSTTMNILTGYLSASDGEVVVDGVDILTRSKQRRKSAICRSSRRCIWI